MHGIGSFFTEEATRYEVWHVVDKWQRHMNGVLPRYGLYGAMHGEKVRGSVFVCKSKGRSTQEMNNLNAPMRDVLYPGAPEWLRGNV